MRLKDALPVSASLSLPAAAVVVFITGTAAQAAGSDNCVGPVDGKLYSEGACINYPDCTDWKIGQCIDGYWSYCLQKCGDIEAQP